MRRSSFLKVLMGITAGAFAAAGCVMRTIGVSITEKPKEQPWRCAKCGHLLRSNEDMSAERCPRCYAKKLGKITEAELQDYLKKDKEAD